MRLKHPANHKHALKSALVLVGIAFVLMIFVFIPIVQTQQEAARQAQIQKQEDDRVEREKAAEAVKTRTAYDKCIEDANDSYGPALKQIPEELHGTARVEAVRLIGEKIESFKKDCDRQYTLVR
jgi:type III secretory pathway component EscR